MPSRKIVLFIVEGITDQTSLGLILSKLIEKDKDIKFKIVETDITTQNGTNQRNILNKVKEQIDEFVKRNIYVKKDILKVVHIVDMDGAYVNDSLVIEKDVEKVEYTPNYIYTKNIEHIRKRNKQKSQILNKLYTTNIVYTNLPYKVYFFSCNLEHVLQDIQNVPNAEKDYYAHKFAERFKDNPNDFIKFINDPKFALNGKYEATWDHIKQGNNSLNRYTNFNLYFD